MRTTDLINSLGPTCSVMVLVLLGISDTLANIYRGVAPTNVQSLASERSTKSAIQPKWYLFSRNDP